jgi:pyruvate formate lyase activating enzyme
MQGIVFDIKRFAVHDGPGIRTTVFLKGCPLKCLWCHNPESIDLKPVHSIKKVRIDGKLFDQNEKVGISTSIDELMDILIKDRLFMEESDGGVTISGGEPTMQPEFLSKLLKSCKEEGLHTALDTCGYASRNTFLEILPYVDLFLFDLKHPNSEKHREVTGQPNDLILENLALLLEYRKNIRIRIPMIPGINFNETDITLMISLLNSFKGKLNQVDLLPYHITAKHKYKRFGIHNLMDGIPGLKKEDLLKTAALFEKEGFQVKIGG